MTDYTDPGFPSAPGEDSADNRLLLRPSEVATALGLGLTKTNELLARGDIASIKIGSARRVPWKALEAFVRDCSR
jgi:excisionase family DNA binding protein